MKQKKVWLGGLMALSFCLFASFAGCAWQPNPDDPSGSTPSVDVPASKPLPDEPVQISQAAIDSVSGQVKFSGTYFYDESGESSVDTSHGIFTVFADGYVHLHDENAETKEVYYDDIYADRDGKLALVYRTATNGIDYQTSSFDFSEYYNQFSTLTPSDFEETETSGTFAVKAESLEKASKVTENITGWVETMASFTVTVENDKIVGLHFVTEEILVDETNGISYVSEYTLTASEWGTAEVDEFYLTPYEHTADHDTLMSALRTAAAAKNYTVRHLDHEDGYEDVDYFVYVGADALYNAYDKYGYLSKDGYVYPFEYDEKTAKVTLLDAINVTSFASVRADFLSVCAELFAYEDEGVYVLRDGDMAASILPFLGEGLDEIQFYAYATSMKIVLSGEQLQSVEFDYYVWGAEGHVTLTYSAFDQTTLPVVFDNMEQTSVLDAYVGEYEDEYGNTATVTVEGGFVFNEKAFAISAYDSESYTFVGTWDNRSVYVAKLTTRQLMVCDESGNVLFLFVLKTDEKVVIPADYLGTWEGEDDENVAHKLTVTADSVTLDEVSLDILSYVPAEGLVAVKGEATYDFLLSNGQMGVIIVENNAYVNTYVLTKTSTSSLIPAAYVGNYEGTKNEVNYRIEITSSAITVIAGGESEEASITAYDDYEGFTLTWKGATYYLMDMSYADSIEKIMFCEESYSVMVSLERVTGGNDPNPPASSVTIPEKFIGDYNGVSADGFRSYAVLITADGIYIRMDGWQYAAEILSYSDSEGFVLKVNGDTYYLMDSSYADPVMGIMLMSEDASLTVMLGRL